MSNPTESAATLNIPLARKVLEHLVAHPEEHDQDQFGKRAGCSTTMCIAGTALWMTPESRYIWRRDGLMVDPDAINDNSGIETQAAEFLGLTHKEAMSLFYTFDNDLALAKLRGHIDNAEAVQHG